MKKLLFFTASYCSACKALKPIVSEEAPEAGYELKFMDMDTDEGIDMAEKFGVRSLPTLVVVDENGNEIKRAVGNTAWKEVQG
jgi:thiol-disulfide isomerase/thioredoxin